MGFTNWISTILLPKQLILTFNGKTYQILRTDPGFADLHAATKAQDLQKIEDYLKQYGYIKVAVEAVAKAINEMNKKQEQEAATDKRYFGGNNVIDDGDIEEEDDDESNRDEMEEDSEEEAQLAETKTPLVVAKTPAKTEKFLTLEVSDDGNLSINGVEFSNSLSKKIAQLYYDGYDITAYYQLIKRIAENAKEAVKSGLLDFVAQNDLPITTDGCFLAYKMTDEKGMDKHTHTINYLEHMYDKTPVDMDRQLVDESRGVCSGRGLYFASKGYYQPNGGPWSIGSGDKCFIVKIDPADVVSIPTTYKNSKGRCCKMLVLREVKFGDDAQLPTSSSIIDVSNWTNIRPTTENKQKNAEVANRTITTAGTQKLTTLSDEVITKIFAYVERRIAAGVYPTIKNVQKAIKSPGTSVTQIAEVISKRAGYTVKPTSESTAIGFNIVTKASKKN